MPLPKSWSSDTATEPNAAVPTPGVQEPTPLTVCAIGLFGPPGIWFHLMLGGLSGGGGGGELGGGGGGWVGGLVGLLLGPGLLLVPGLGETESDGAGDGLGESEGVSDGSSLGVSDGDGAGVGMTPRLSTPHRS